MFIMSSDNFLIITSSPDDLAKLGETAEKKEIDDVLKKINVPSDADEKSFVYWNREFSAFVNLLLLNRPYTFKFMKDFSGSDVFCTFDFDDDEIEIKQYASLPVSQIFLMPFALNMMAYYDTFVFRQGRRKYIAGKKELQRKKCLDEMKEYASKLKTYREKSGKYPEGVNAEGLKNFALFAGIPAERFTLHITKDRAVPFARYYYWGENSFSTRKDLPLFCDRGSAHPDKIHVIFCDGSVREFELENVRSAKRIASFLHTVFKYDNETFVMLLKQAEKLDSEKL